MGCMTRLVFKNKKTRMTPVGKSHGSSNPDQELQTAKERLRTEEAEDVFTGKSPQIVVSPEIIYIQLTLSRHVLCECVYVCS